MIADADLTLPQWVVGVVAGSIVALLGFLARFVFAGVFKRLDEITDENRVANREQLTEIKVVAATVQTHGTELALATLRIAQLEASFAAQLVKYDDLAKFLQSDGFRKRDGP